MTLKYNGKSLQEMQEELDSFIIEKNKLEISESELLKNMILACHDELIEVSDAIDDTEEWIDVLHFLLSIANRLNVDISEAWCRNGLTPNTCLSIVQKGLFNVTRLSRCFKHWSLKKMSEDDVSTIEMILNDCINCIYTVMRYHKVDMREEYIKKYEINIERQMTGNY